jgi:hypothetical protein
MGEANRAGEGLTQVALHEFGHVLGLPHGGGIMERYSFKAPQLCLKKADTDAFCKVNARACGKLPMFPCD